MTESRGLSGKRRSLLLSVSLWGLAFGLLEVSYFTRQNAILPLGLGHLWLAIGTCLFYVALAVFPLVGLRLFSRGYTVEQIAALGACLPAWWLLTILAVSFYRTTVNPVPRTVEGTMWTLAIVVLALATLPVLRLLSRRSPRVLRRASHLAAVVLAVLGLGTLLAFGPQKATPGPAGGTEIAAAPAACSDCPRVLLIGLDGGDWKVLDPMIERGELPAFERLLRRGVSARLQTVTPTSSPLIWTSVASGKSVDKHGVRDHTRSRLPLGLPPAPMQAKWFRTLTKPSELALRIVRRLRPLTPLKLHATQVEAVRLWEILDVLGLKSIVLDWYVTHPAALKNGVQVSHQFHKLKGAVASTPGLVQPPELAEILEPEIVAADELDEELVWDLLDVADLDAEGRGVLRQQRAEWFDAIRWEMARDLTTRSVAEAVFPLVSDWSLACVYYRAMDISQHLSWASIDSKKPAGSSTDSDWRFRKVVERYYRHSDELLAATLEHADENTVVIVLSDHGWEDNLRGHDFAPDGFLIMAGGAIKASEDRLDIHVYDIAPTVLAILGLPVPEDMDGRVASEFVEDSFWNRHRIRSGPSYDWAIPSRASGEESELDEETKRQLKALGYLG